MIFPPSRAFVPERRPIECRAAALISYLGHPMLLLSRREASKTRHPGLRSSSIRPELEQLEPVMLLSFADGNGPVVQALTEVPGSTKLVITFDGPLNPGPASASSNYQVTKALPNPELVSSRGAGLAIVSASYSDASASQVTLTLKRALQPGVFYRVFINGTPGSMSVNPASNPLTDINGVWFDGDNDDTAGGNFYGLLAVGKRIKFTDSSGDRAAINVKGGGAANVWRELNGDVDQLSVVSGGAGSVLTGSVIKAKGSTGSVYVGSVTIPTSTPLVLGGATDALPPSFIVLTQGLAPPAPPPTAVSPNPVVATGAELPVHRGRVAGEHRAHSLASRNSIG